MLRGMPMFDLTGAELRAHRGDVKPPEDLQEFWTETLAAARGHGGAPTLTPVATPLRLIETFDVTFPGYAGDPIRAWLHRPAGASEALPCVVEYRGYGGGRGLAHEAVRWAVAGYAHFIMDSRGQGSGYTTGETPDLHPSSAAQPGVMTRGILDRDSYYYRRLFTDAVRAVDAARALPAVDADRVAVTGMSQGGGISLAVAALVPDLVGVMPDVPYLCDMRRATEIGDKDPYGEIVRYLKAHRDHVDRVFETLRYFDGTALATLAGAPALFSVALMDEICPPSTVYAAYNAYAGTKEIREYAYNDHEGGGPFHELAQLTWLAERLQGSSAGGGRGTGSAVGS
jgi:cephalosporin-C deacetylase